MFMVAAKALASCSPTLKDPKANLLPPLDNIREVSFTVAVAVAKEAVAEGLTAEKYTDAEVVDLVRNHVWDPKYLPYKRGAFLR